MGTWGFGAFDNDNSVDWCYALKYAEDLAPIENALSAILNRGKFERIPRGPRVQRSARGGGGGGGTAGQSLRTTARGGPRVHRTHLWLPFGGTVAIDPRRRNSGSRRVGIAAPVGRNRRR